MRISECREEDVVLLDAHMPCPGSSSLHGPRFVRHREGASTFLIAWQGQLPVGSCEVLWHGCDAPEVRAVHENCPEIQGLGNWPGTLRAQSVGTALIQTAEAHVRERGSGCVGLGVERNNPRTADLYKRLGYTPSTPYLDCGVYLDGKGVFHRVADACTFMVKYL